MSLSLIAQTYNFEGDDTEQIDDETQEEFSGETEGTPVGSSVQLETSSSNSLPASVALDGEGNGNTNTVSTNCTKKTGGKSRTKRAGNWMWTYKSQRAPRPKRRRVSKNKRTQNPSDMDILPEPASDIDNEKLTSSTPTVNPTDSLTEEGNNDKRIEPFKCPFCLQVSLGREGLIEHLRIVHKVQSPTEAGDQLTEIVKIEEVTPNRLILSDDTNDDSAKISLKKKCKTRVSPSSQQFKCHLCGFALTNRSNLERHMKIHTESWRPWKCSKCKSFFKTLSHLRMHENLVHNQKLRMANYACKKGFSRSKSSNHVKKTHKNDVGASSSMTDFNSGTESSAHKATTKFKNGIHLLVKSTIQRRREVSLKQNTNTKRSKVETTADKGEKVSWENISGKSGNVKIAFQRSHRCNQCGFSFNYTSHLHRHMKIHKKGPNRPWKCSQCSSFFVIKPHLTLHEIRLHRRKPGATKHSCRICRKKFEWSKLLVHMRIHSQERPYKCPRCKKLFRQTVHLQRHLKAIHGEEQKISQLNLSPEYQNCETFNPEQITDEASRNRIVSSSSPPSSSGRENQAFKCPYCMVVIKENEKFIEHLQSHTTKGERCSLDDTGAKSSHRRKAGGSKNQPKCDLCTTRFTSKANLSRHMLIHREIHRPWKCSQCSSFFLAANALRIHENQVHNRTPGGSKCVCKICGKVFPPSTLLVHMRIHNGEKPFRCHRCNDKFRQLHHLQGHLKTVHGLMKSTSELKSLETTRSETTLRPHGNVLISEQFGQRICKIILHRCDENDSLQGNASNVSRASNETKPFTCELCPISFAYRRSVETHYDRIHFGARPHKCSKCDQAFYVPDDLEIHSAVHTQNDKT